MSRRRLLGLLGGPRGAPLAAALLLAATLGVATGCARQPSRPWSVLLLTVDTLRPDYLSFNGYPLPTSPTLDALLDDSLYFERAMAPIGRTTPALASLLTGAYPHATGVRSLTDALDAAVMPLAEPLSAAGYQTAAVVTNQLVPPERRLDRGFDTYDWGGDTRTAAETTELALSRVAALDPGRPALVWVHYIDPHMPYHSNRRLAKMFDPDYRGRFRWSFGWQPRPGQPEKTFRIFPKELPKAVAVHDNPLPERVNEHIRRLYAADVRLLDDQVGRVIEAMRQRWGDSLIIVFTADHGESLGENDFYFDHGDYAYQAALRVPLAFSLPADHPLRATGRCPGRVSLVDVAPTLFGLIERPLPPTLAGQLEGRSLVPCFRGEELPAVPLFAESGHSYYFEHVRRRVTNDVAGRFRAVVLDDWKLIWTPFLPDEEAWELYDLASDPDEERDLYRPGHPRVATLRAALSTWLARQRPGEGDPAAPPSAEDLEALRALGYIE